MKMNKEKYEELMRRFSQELHEIGVTEDMMLLAKDSINRTPNVASYSGEDVVNKFCYTHDGYSIEAKRTITLSIKKCKK